MLQGKVETLEDKNGRLGTDVRELQRQLKEEKNLRSKQDQEIILMKKHISSIQSKEVSFYPKNTNDKQPPRASIPPSFTTSNSLKAKTVLAQALCKCISV